MYDGFISYSHAADDLLAPRLQAGLQRFAKPWWRRRALRVFRDESSLSANPHLWSSITEALDESGWFVLLLSPDAAQSEWVNQEVAYWVGHKDQDRIIPVVTAGEFGWDGDVTGDAVPVALRGVLSEEPRWVDARGLRDPERLDLKDPEFAAVVADLAAPLRGVPKDELASEEVRQHKRTVRTAWAAGIVVLVLAVAASAAAVFALDRQREAERQKDLAESHADDARDAEANALRAAANAESRRLAATATLELADDGQRSMLLALEAMHVAFDAEVADEAEGILRRAVTENRLVDRLAVDGGSVDWPPPVRFDDGQAAGRTTLKNRGAIAPDGSVVYYLSRVSNSLSAIRVVDGQRLWHFQAGDAMPDGELLSVSASPDGVYVAVSIQAPEGTAGTVVILDADTGRVEHELRSGGCHLLLAAGPGFSPDGRWFSVLDGDERCTGVPSPPDADWITVYEVGSWEQALSHRVDGASAERLLLAEGGVGLIAYRAGGPAYADLVTFPDLDLVTEVGETAFFPAVSPTGDMVLAAVFAPSGGFADETDPWSVQRWTAQQDVFGALGWRIAPVHGYKTESGFDLDDTRHLFHFSPDGSLVAVGCRASDVNGSGLCGAVLNPVTGSVVLAFGEKTDTYDLSWDADGSTLLTVHDDEMLLWEVVPDTARLNRARASQDWAGFALESALVRGFEATECTEFLIADPCPTSLGDVRNRYGGLGS